MALLFGIIVAFVAGLALGRRWQAFAVAAVAWYLFLAVGTAHLAQPGHAGFGGQNGLKLIQGAPYWLVQPAVLALSIGLLLVGALVRRRVAGWIGSGDTAQATEAITTK